MRTRSLPARLKNLCNSWGIGTPKKRHWTESRKSRTFAIEPLEERALLSLCVWDGGGTDDKWTTAENWANDIAPVVGDDLRFSGTVQTDTENDYTAGTSFRSINFASSGFSITGNDLTLTNNITVNSGVTGSTVFVGVGLGSTVTVNSGNTSLTLSGVISGSNALVKSNSGTLILTGNNTYTGTTTITYGTLQVGNGGTSGTLGTGTVTGGDDEDSVTLAFNRSDTATIGNSISGYVNMVQRGTGTLIYTGNDSCSGGVTVNSGGTLVLTGSNTYTHTTTINAGGTLRIGSDNPSVLPNGSGKANVTVKGVLDLNGYAPTVNGLDGTGRVTSGVAGATTLTVGAGNRSGSFSGVIQDGAGTVALTKTGTATQTLTGTNTYSGTTTISQGTLQIGNGSSGTLGTGPVVNNGLLRFQRNMTIANSISGTGGLYVGYGTLILTGNNTYSGTTTIRGNATLQVGNGGTSGTLGTGAVTGGDDEDNATLTFNRSDIVTIDKSISGYIDLIQDGTGTLIYTGNNSCSGGMTVNSGGTLVLTGSNTYTNTTTINAGGTLQIGSDNPNVLPNGTGKWNVTVNGVLDLNGYAPTINGLNGSGTVRSGVAGATTLTVGAGNRSGSFSGVIQDGAGTVALTKTGTATQTLTGTNTYSGTTTISQGTLQIGNGSSGTLGTGPVVNNGLLRFQRNMIVANSISGTGGLYVGYGTLILTGNNTYAGTTTIVGNATLQVGNGGTSGTVGTGAVTGGNDEDNATLAFNRSDTVTLDNAISGYVTLDQRGTGTLIYIGNNSSGGGTRISGGTLQVGDGGTMGTLGSSSAYVTSSGGGGQLVFDRSDNITVGNRISGAIDLVQQGTGVVLLTGNNTYTGDTTINAGTLQVTGSVTRTSSVTNHGTLLVSGTGSIVRGGVSLSGTGGTPSGSETYLSWKGLSGDAGTTYTTEVSTDNGVTYTAVASVAADTSTFVATGLQRNTAYRTRIVATSASGAKEIYETGSITTLDQPDESAWYRVDSITSDEDGSVLSPSVLGFTQDDSWTYAGSPMGAVLQQVQGLVTDGSIPTIDANGEVKVWHVVDKDGSVIISDFYTFAYPSGGYSEVIRYITPYTVGLPPMDLGGGGPPPCTNPCNCGSAGGGGAGGGGGGGGGCGGPGRSGASRIAMNAINSIAGASMCNLGGQSGLTYSSRELTFDSGYGPGWSDVDELAAMVVAENVMAVRLGAEQALWFDVQLDGSFAARYGSQDTLVHDATNHLFVLTRDDGTRYEFYDGEQTDHPAGSLHRTVAPSGATIEVSGWTETGENGRVAEVLYKTATDGPAYQKRVFTYVTTDDGIQHIQTLTLLEYDAAASAWVNVRQITYGYYADGDAYGLPGDLKTILTQQWDAAAEDWTGHRHELLPLLHRRRLGPRGKTRAYAKRLRRLRGRLRRPGRSDQPQRRRHPNRSPRRLHLLLLRIRRRPPRQQAGPLRQERRDQLHQHPKQQPPRLQQLGPQDGREPGGRHDDDHPTPTTSARCS